MKINIRVNGSEKEWDDDAIPYLETMVKRMVKNDHGLIAEVNEKIIHRERWAQYTVTEGDVIELISMVGGG